VNENIFFNPARLKRCGRNVIIGKTVRIRYPELVEIGDNTIIDDFTYISTAVVIDGNCHISAGCKLIGGQQVTIHFGRFSTLAPNVVLAAGSDDYVGGIATPMVPSKYKGNVEYADIWIGRHSIVGANSTVLPGTMFEEGAALGAQSLAKGRLEAWRLYGGVPCRALKNRNRAQIIQLERDFEQESNHEQ